MKKIIFTLIISCVFILHATAQVTVTGAATGNGEYTTLGEAITAIGTSQTGQTITIGISASTTEAAAGIVIGAGTWTSLTIYPTADNVTLTSSVTSNALIQFSGANNVTVDGRVNQTGARSMTLSSTGTTNATINFTGDATHAAQNNTVKYCTITGSSNSTSKGIIAFGAVATVANGFGLNTFDHNLITNNGTRPINTIYSLGNTASPTTGNIITNNEFKDCLNWGAASQIISLPSTSFNTGWTIKGNRFYETGSATCNASVSIINVQKGTDYDISDNVIGGSASDNSGTWTKSGNNSSAFIAINFVSASTGGIASSIKNNVIKNFSWTNTAGGTWTGILVGSASAAIIEGNYIGDNTTTGSIVTSNGAVNGVVTGISITSSAAIDCINNKIGSITANSTGFVVAINAINKGTGAANANISNNIIGSSSVDNSIYSSTVIGVENVKGILCTGTGTNTISNNEIGSLTTGSTSGVVNAIDLGAGTNTVNANLIYNLSSPNSATTTLNGINLPANGINTCSNNIISLGNNYANTINGINEAVSTTANNYYYNTIYITGAPTTLALNSFGISSASTANNRNIKNNIIWNNRVNSGATGSNYAIYLGTYSSGTLVCDYNDLYVTSDAKNFVGKYGSSDKSDLDAWKLVSISPDANSISVTPGFASPNKTALSYKGTAFFAGTPISGIASDYGGNTRGSNMGAWDLPITWNGTAWSATPSASLNAIINGTYSDAGFNCLDLTINAGKQTTISSGTLTVAGNMTLKSDATNGTATFIDNGGTLSVGAGKTFVEQYLTSGRNWYVASPVSAATSNVFAASVANPVYYYVETVPNTWSQITNTSTNLDAKKGYIANINSDRVVTFTGGSLNTGTQTISGLTSGGATFTGFNLVGNPYPSYLNWSTASKTNVSTSIWYRSKSTGSYQFQTYNVAGPGIGVNGGTNLIPSMQAFWVKVTSGTGSIEFVNNDRTHLNQSVATNRLKAPAADTRTIVRLQVASQTNADETVIYTDNDALNSFDTFDSNKMFNNDESVPEIFTVVGTEKLAINGFGNLSANQEMALGFKTTTANTFTIKATEVKNLATDTKIILVDKGDNDAETDLTEGAVYSFSSDAENTISRFSIVFRVSGTTTNLTKTNVLDAQVFVNSDNQITIVAPENCNYIVYNALGQKLSGGITVSNRTMVNTIRQAGVYIVKLSESGQNFSSRVIIK